MFTTRFGLCVLAALSSSVHLAQACPFARMTQGTPGRALRSRSNRSGNSRAMNASHSKGVRSLPYSPECAARFGEEQQFYTVWSKIRDELVQLMQDNDHTCASRRGDFCASSFLRLGWHVSGTYDPYGGPTGRSPHGGSEGSNFWKACGNDDGCGGCLYTTVGKMEDIQVKYANAGVSVSDLIIFAAGLAAEHLADGGFSLPFYPGRQDVSTMMNQSMCMEIGGRLPAPAYVAGAQGAIGENAEPIYDKIDLATTYTEISKVFKQLGLTPQDMAALIGGGHSSGKASLNGGATPGQWVPPQFPLGSTYWKFLSGHGKGWCAVLSSDNDNALFVAGGPNAAPPALEYSPVGQSFNCTESRGGVSLYEDLPTVDRNLITSMVGNVHGLAGAAAMLPCDFMLQYSDTTNVFVEQWKDDQASFYDAFAAAWGKLTANGVGTVCPDVRTPPPTPAPCSDQCYNCNNCPGGFCKSCCAPDSESCSCGTGSDYCDGGTNCSGCTGVASYQTVMCACGHPSSTAPAENDFACTDGTTSYCSSNEVCFATASFPKGEWATGCEPSVSMLV